MDEKAYVYLFLAFALYIIYGTTMAGNISTV